MKKISIFLVLMFTLIFMAGCGETDENIIDPVDTSDEIPTYEELVAANNYDEVFKKHNNIYVNIVCESDLPENVYTSENFYYLDGESVNYNIRTKYAGEDSFNYTTKIGGEFYYYSANTIMTLLYTNEEIIEDYTLDLTFDYVGEPYLEGDQIVLQAQLFYEDFEEISTRVADYTIYFNKDTRLLEKITYLSHDENTARLYDYVAEISYDAENVFEENARDFICERENFIELEIIMDHGSDKEASYKLASTTDAMIGIFYDVKPCYLFTDPGYENAVWDLAVFEGEKSLTLYALPES